MIEPVLVLVIDDNATNLKLAASVLEASGFTVERACSAEDARQILAHSLPDVILMDIQMPGMDGLTLTRLLKADPAYRHIPIIALTSFAMKGDEQHARDAGCDAYVTKPIDTRRLPLLIAEVLHAASERQTDDESWTSCS